MKPLSRQSDAGFTIMEMIVVVVIMGILAAIAAPNMLAILSRQRLNTAQAEAITAVREAQAKAKQQRRVWTACFKDEAGKVQWAVSPVAASKCNEANPWNDVNGPDANKIAIDPSTSKSVASDSGNFYAVSFKENGWVDSTSADNSVDIGTITFITRNQPNASKRCVYVATLIGAMRTGSDKDCKKPE